MKKVLIITYYWPPAGGSGVQRWLKFSKYLPENGWRPIIYTPENPSFQIQDKELSSEINSNTEVWKLPIWEPYSLRNKLFGYSDNSNSGIIQNRNSIKNKMMNWIRGNLFIPDPKIYWVNSSVKFLIKSIQEEKIDYIVSTGPPHSMHLIALSLKKYFPNIKWIADFRDPWSELDLLDEFYLSKRSRKKHVKLEKEVITSADITLTVSETWAKSLKNLGASRVELITNGFDDIDLSPKEIRQDKFIIGHYGLLNHLRNPSNLWDILNSICKKDKVFHKKLEIRLAGNIDTEVFDEIKRYPYLKSQIVNLGYLSHKDVIKEYNKVDLFLLLIFNSNSGVGNYPGKIFEYFAIKRPILAFGPEKSDTKELIIKTSSGFYYDYNTIGDLEEHIMKIYNKEIEFKFSDKIDQFNRKNLTKELVVLLNSL